MFLIDSNIIVYSYLQQYEYLRDLFVKELVFISGISRVEVLGYHILTPNEEIYFKDIFSLMPIIFPSEQVFDVAISIRKKYNRKLGDSLIAATASVHGLTIYSRNLKDFEKITSINCINPLF